MTEVWKGTELVQRSIPIWIPFTLSGASDIIIAVQEEAMLHQLSCHEGNLGRVHKSVHLMPHSHGRETGSSCGFFVFSSNQRNLG